MTQFWKQWTKAYRWGPLWPGQGELWPWGWNASRQFHHRGGGCGKLSSTEVALRPVWVLCTVTNLCPSSVNNCSYSKHSIHETFRNVSFLISWKCLRTCTWHYVHKVWVSDGRRAWEGGSTPLSGAGCGVFPARWFRAQALGRIFVVKSNKSFNMSYAQLPWLDFSPYGTPWQSGRCLIQPFTPNIPKAWQ